MPLFLQLFIEFFKIGLFAVGGGLATLPFLYNLAVVHPEWYNTSQLVDMVAVSESTPGPMGINMSTYVGFTTDGLFGAIMSTMGLVVPSIIVILIVAKLLEKFKTNESVQNVFYGIRPASMGLIASAALLVMKSALLDLDAYSASGSLMDLFKLKSIIFAVILLVALRKIKLHPIAFIAVAAVAGCIFKF
jgi:chromate transporter